MNKAERTRYYIYLEKKRAMFFQKLYKELNRYFLDLYKKLAKSEVNKDEESTKLILALKGKKLKTLLLTNYGEIVNYFSNMISKELTNKKQLSLDMWTGLLLAKMEERAGSKIVGINEVVLEYIRRELKRGILEGESIHEISQRLMANQISFSRGRAICVARTEVIGTSNSASFETARFVDDKLKKVWITTIDGRERPWHADADGQVVGMNEKFMVYGEDLDYPGDPMGSAENVINCRCAIAYES